MIHCSQSNKTTRQPRTGGRKKEIMKTTTTTSYSAQELEALNYLEHKARTYASKYPYSCGYMFVEVYDNSGHSSLYRVHAAALASEIRRNIMHYGKSQPITICSLHKVSRSDLCGEYDLFPDMPIAGDCPKYLPSVTLLVRDSDNYGVSSCVFKRV